MIVCSVIVLKRNPFHHPLSVCPSALLVMGSRVLSALGVVCAARIVAPHATWMCVNTRETQSVNWSTPPHQYSTSFCYIFFYFHLSIHSHFIIHLSIHSTSHCVCVCVSPGCPIYLGHYNRRIVNTPPYAVCVLFFYRVFSMLNNTPATLY